MEQRNPEISIIVPIYNVEKYLCECIDCLLVQEFRNFELLLIDGGSTDGSGTICNQYEKKDNRVKVFHKINGGVSSARNLGLVNAKGEWITFVDSDDSVTPYYLSDLYACTHAGIGLVVQSLNHVRKNGEALYEYKLPKEYKVYDTSDFAKMVKEQSLSQRGYTFSKLFKKELLDKKCIRFNTEIKFCEDWIFLFSYLNVTNQKVCCSPVSNYFYIDREGSLSHAENDFKSEYATFCVIKDIALEFCSKYNSNVVDLDPTYMLHKAITLVTSKAQLCCIRDVDWDFFNRYYPVTSMKTSVDKWMISHFYKYKSLLFLYLYLVRNFRKLLERYNLWTIVDFLRK